ncbi:MAG: hypothetical protein ACYS8Z_02445 [Planctomycetota bacterium]|jgi:hypothetical protein
MDMDIRFVTKLAFVGGVLGLGMGGLGLARGADPIGSAGVLIASAIVIASSITAAALTSIVDKILQSPPAS